MDGNECKAKKNIHNNKRKLKITCGVRKKIPITYNTLYLQIHTFSILSCHKVQTAH